MIFFDAIQHKQLDSLFIARSSVWKDDLCSCYHQSTRYITNPHCAGSATSWSESPHGQAGLLRDPSRQKRNIWDLSCTSGPDIQTPTNNPHQEGSNFYPYTEHSSLELLPSKPILSHSCCREYLGFRRVFLGGMNSELLQHCYLWSELPEPQRLSESRVLSARTKEWKS